MIKQGNIFADIPDPGEGESLETLAETDRFRLERIVSHGEATPAGQWFDQDRDEWVILLSGSAGLRFEEESRIRELRPGNYLLIPAHRRHRVEWTEAGGTTVWLALHYEREE